MSDDKIKDETEGFVITTSDLPVVETKTESDSANADQIDSGATDESGKEETSKDESESGKSATAEDDESPKAEEPKGKNRVQKRINAVVREREEAKRRAEAAEKSLAELKKSNETELEQGKEPVESDFGTYDEYLAALDKFDASASDPEKDETKPEDIQEPGADIDDKLTDAQRTAMAVIKEKIAPEIDNYPDFQDVALNPDVPITGDMLEALAECDDPTKVMYHLGQNKDLAAEIADKTPAQQMREIARLDLTAKIIPLKPAKMTKTAEPIAPVSGSDAQKKDINDMSFSEYEAMMNKREREGGKRW